MKNKLLNILTVFLSSVIALLFIYYKLPAAVVQTSIAILAVVLLVIINKFILIKSKSINQWLQLALLFLLALSVQLIVFSTGGFSSSFLILFHLFAIGSSFLVSLPAGVSFLVFALSALATATWLDNRLLTIFLDSPWTVVLYVTSFIVIIPITHIVATRYYIKDALSNFLTKQLKLSKLRQETLLESLPDLIIVTDINFKILSFNSSVEKTLLIPRSELLNRPIFDVVFIRDPNGGIVNSENNEVKKALTEKASQKIPNLLLMIKNEVVPRKVNIQIRPTPNLEGNIDQIAFIISDLAGIRTGSEIHKNIESSYLKHLASVEKFKNNLASRGRADLEIEVELASKAEKDIVTITEIQDHGIKTANTPLDIADLIKHTVDNEKYFAKNLKVDLEFTFSERFFAESAKLVPKGMKIDPGMLTSAFYTAPVDPKWFDMLLQKLTDLSIMLASSTAEKKVNMTLGYDVSGVDIIINLSFPYLSPASQRLLFTEYYGDLGTKTNLSLGSGLEGYVAKILSGFLNIPIGTRSQPDPALLYFMIRIPKLS